MLPISLRTTAGEEAYQQAKLGGELLPLPEEVCLKQFVYWRLINNRFPADMAFETCHMLIPKRKFAEVHEMNAKEQYELLCILTDLEKDYDQVAMNFPANRSVKDHFHLHLTKFYSSRDQMRL